MNLPEANGTYVLIALLTRMKRLEIGGLGACDVMPGYYAYVGSAFGTGVRGSARRAPGDNRSRSEGPSEAQPWSLWDMPPRLRVRIPLPG